MSKMRIEDYNGYDDTFFVTKGNPKFRSICTCRFLCSRNLLQFAEKEDRSVQFTFEDIAPVDEDEGEGEDTGEVLPEMD
jgi:hypothetical protein